MASEETPPAPASGFHVSNKLQRKLNVLNEAIECEKREVLRIGREMRDAISRKEEEVLRALDAIRESVNVRVEEKKLEIQNKIEEIEKREKEVKKMYEEMESLFKDIKHTLPPQPLPRISDEIEAVKRDMDVPIPFVKVAWRVDELRTSINRMCHCEQQIREVASYQHRWKKGKFGHGESNLYSPHGIAINPLNDNVYVTDWGRNRVQIFSKEGEFNKSFTHNEMVKPENILFLTDSIYILCDGRIVEFLESCERFEKCKSYDFPLRGICTDKTHIFVGNSRAVKLIVLTADLTEEKLITLNTEFCKQGVSEIRDLSLPEEEIYVLLSKSEYPIQAFSKEGILTRRVIRKNIIRDADYLCVDQQLNLIVSDKGERCVKIFSNDGNILKRLGQGMLYGLSGVVVDKLGYVYVVQNPQPPSYILFVLLHLFS